MPLGPVAEVAARVIAEVEGDRLVALGGGRVIDVAKAIAAARGGRVAALPTTLSGAEMTRIHRLPDGQEAVDGLVRPEIVIADPPLMVTLPELPLRASAMNALAHGADSLYTPLSNPVAEMAALRGAALIARSLDTERSDRDAAGLALGSILCAYAMDSALFGLHHVVCQTLVRTMQIPHAQTNATLLPWTIEALIPRAGKQMTALARALGTKRRGAAGADRRARWRAPPPLRARRRPRRARRRGERHPRATRAAAAPRTSPARARSASWSSAPGRGLQAGFRRRTQVTPRAACVYELRWTRAGGLRPPRAPTT